MTASSTDSDVPSAAAPRPRRLQHRASPTFFDRVRRAAFGVVWSCVGRPSPVVCHGFRANILRAFGARLGPGVHVYPRARIWAPWNLAMERGACLAQDVNCYNVARIWLAPDAIVSQGASLCTASHDFDADDFSLVTAPISIEAGAWVCAEAFVGPGVTLGKRAVVLARAVVVRDVEANAVMGGNPARKVRDREER